MKTVSLQNTNVLTKIQNSGDNHGHLLADISAVRSSLMTGMPLGCDASEKKQGV